jgi:hypothetical protein
MTAAMLPTTHSAQVATPTQPATRQVAMVYCPMVKANWLQAGDTVVNPYLGQQMSDCGTVQKKINVSSDDALAQVVRSYLDVGKALNADRLDAAALQSLHSAAASLKGDQYSNIRDAAAKLAIAKDLAGARATFHALSDQLIALLGKA